MEFDRFARNRYNNTHYKFVLRKKRFEVDTGYRTYFEDSAGILFETLHEDCIELFRVEFAQKVVLGMTENALKYKYNGGIIPVVTSLIVNYIFRLTPTQC